jgi:simple sugar transport system substrate-binding protein
MLPMFLFAGGSSESAGGQTAVRREICVFVPGVLAGSPTYQMLADGVKAAASAWEADNPGAACAVTVLEAQFNQAEWESKLTAVTATGKYEFIISTNPSLPDIVRRVHAKFPRQKFMLLDGEISGVENVYSLKYDTGKEAELAGYFAALVTKSQGAGSAVGLLAAQEYPVMNEVILPGYKKGAASGGLGSVDFRVLGNWFDAEKARLLAMDMYRSGCGVILCIAGSANQGVLQAAEESGGKIVWFDSDGSAASPDVVLGSAIVRQDLAAEQKTRAALDGTLSFGICETPGANDTYIDFIPGPRCPPDIAAAMKKIK